MESRPLYVLLVNGTQWMLSTSPAIVGERVADLDRTGISQCINCAHVVQGPSPHAVCPLCYRSMLYVHPAGLHPARLEGEGLETPVPLTEDECAAFLVGYARAWKPIQEEAARLIAACGRPALA